MRTLKDVYHAGHYFFRDPDYTHIKMRDFRNSYSPELIGAKLESSTNPDEVLLKTEHKINRLQNWDALDISNAIKSIGKELGQPSRDVMQILRYALAGMESGVGVPMIIYILGKDKAIRRLESCRSHE